MNQMPLNIDPSLMQVGKVNRGGMFGNADWGSALAAALAGFSAGGGSQAGALALKSIYQNRLDKQTQEREDQQYQRKLNDQWNLWQRQQQFKLEHPEPVVNDTVNDYKFIIDTLGADAGKRFLETKTNPIVMTPYGPMPYSAVNGGGAPVSRPVGRLTPIEDGGPTPQASGGFPSFGY